MEDILWGNLGVHNLANVLEGAVFVTTIGEKVGIDGSIFQFPEGVDEKFQTLSVFPEMFGVVIAEDVLFSVLHGLLGLFPGCLFLLGLGLSHYVLQFYFLFHKHGVLMIIFRRNNLLKRWQPSSYFYYPKGRESHYFMSLQQSFILILRTCWFDAQALKRKSKQNL